MLNVPIQSIPNQQFSISLENNTYEIAIKITNSQMSMSIVRNSVTIVDNARCVAGAPIIPSIYEEDGNFIFFTQGQQLPNYLSFNNTQSLTYLTTTELAAYRTPPVASSPRVPTVTASFFNSLGALPLRFAPQGYTLAP